MNTSTPEPRRLDSSLWPSVGLYRWNGVITHALGDEYAQQVLTGEIPLEEAQAAERNAREHGVALLKGML